MAKILIASIGTGRQQGNENRYAYDVAEYFLSSEPDQCVETPLIISAIKRYYQIEKLILMGTSGSDWASLYDYIYSERNTDIECTGTADDSFYAELDDVFKDARQRPPKVLPVQEMQDMLIPLKRAMGNFCDSICVLHYGTDNEEQISNLAILNQIANRLNNNDEIYFDISHSFRSLPLYELLVVNLAKAALKRDIKMKLVTYGMHEARYSFDYRTPIVDMTQLVELIDWTRAIDEYNRFGTAYLLGELCEGETAIAASIRNLLTKEAIKALRLLGDSITANNIADFQTLVRRCSRVINNESYQLSRDPLLTIFERLFTDIDNEFGKYKDDMVALQLTCSVWHFKNKRYLHCAISAIEGLLRMFLGVLGEDNHKDNRLKMRSILTARDCPRSNDSHVKKIIATYRTANKTRNDLAHGESLDAEGLQKLGDFSVNSRTLYLEQFEQDGVRRDALRVALSEKW